MAAGIEGPSLVQRALQLENFSRKLGMQLRPTFMSCGLCLLTGAALHQRGSYNPASLSLPFMISSSPKQEGSLVRFSILMCTMTYVLGRSTPESKKMNHIPGRLYSAGGMNETSIFFRLHGGKFTIRRWNEIRILFTEVK